MTVLDAPPSPEACGYLTVAIEDHLFALPVAQVHDVFRPDNPTGVPLAPPEIAGVVNMRGRIVTLLDLRRRLGLPASDHPEDQFAVGVESDGESYALLVDRVGEVVSLPVGRLDTLPSNLDARWTSLITGVQRMDKARLLALDVDRILHLGEGLEAA